MGGNIVFTLKIRLYHDPHLMLLGVGLIAKINGVQQEGENLTDILSHVTESSIKSLEVIRGSLTSSEITAYFGYQAPPLCSNLETFIHDQTEIPVFPGGCLDSYPSLKKVSVWVSVTFGGCFRSCPLLEEVFFKGNPKLDFSTPFQNSNIKKFTALNYNQQDFLFYKTSPIEIVILPAMKRVRTSLFSSLKKLKYVELSAEPVTIERSAFESCSLTELPKCKFGSIGTYAFRNCPLTKIELNDNVSIGLDAFAGCQVETFSAPNIELLGIGMFSECTKLISIKAPLVTSIPPKLAYGCSNLTSVVFHSGPLYVGSSAFQGCTSLPWLDLEFSEIGFDAFSGCTFQDITISGNPKITFGTFSKNSNLKTFTALELTSIDSLFTDCLNLVKINIPKVTSIPDNLAEHAEFLTTVIMTKDEIQKIGKFAFRGCTQLKWENWNIRSIGMQAFASCSFTDVTIVGECDINILAFARCPLINFVAKDMTRLKDIFSGCKSLKHVEIPRVTEIPYTVMKGRTSLETLIVSTQPMTIGDEAFSGCTSLKWPSWTLLHVGKKAFSKCTFPKVIINGEPFFENDVFLESEIATFSAPSLTQINSIFNSCNSLAYIDMPCCTKVLASAFSNLPKLATVILSQVYPVSVEESAFAKCSSLQFPSCVFSTIGSNAFLECTFNSVVIYESPTISFDAFKGCKNLQTFTEKGLHAVDFASIAPGCPIQTIILEHATDVSNIPTSVISFTSMGIKETKNKRLFNDLNNLKTLKLEALEKLDFGFPGCLHLSEVSLDGVEEITKQATFSGTKLSSISLHCLVSVSNSILLFENCPLKRISLPAHPPHVFHRDTFAGCKNCVLVIPDGSAQLYDNDVSVEGDQAGDHKWCGLKVSDKVPPEPTQEPGPIPSREDGSKKMKIISVTLVMLVVVGGGVIIFIIWKFKRTLLLDEPSYESLLAQHTGVTNL